jgi:hypothetical protein
MNNERQGADIGRSTRRIIDGSRRLGALPGGSDLARQAIDVSSPATEQALSVPPKLRELAAWYRELAERAGNPAIWEARLRTADDLDLEAERIEREFVDRG